MFFLGIILMLAAIVAAIGGSVALFISPVSIILTCGISLFLILGTYSGKGIKLLFRLFFTLNVEEADLKLGLKVYKDTKLYLIVAGWIGVIIGAILMLANLDDPDAIGPGAAMCLITVFYGYILAYFFCHPVIRRLEEKLG